MEKIQRLMDELEELDAESLELVIDRSYELLRGRTQDPARSRAAVARSVIDFLNRRAGRNFDLNNRKNLDFVCARLKEGYSEQTIKQVTAMMCRKWRNTEMDAYLRPATLYNATKFAQYHGLLGTRRGRADEGAEASR